MIEFIPYILQISLSLAVGLVSVFLYSRNKRFGLALLSVGFFLNAVPSVVNLALGGPYLTLRLMDQGYTSAEIGVVYSYLFLFSGAIEIIFAVLVIAGIVELAKQQRNTGQSFFLREEGS